MSVEQIGKTLLPLPREERRQFADWFYQHENQIVEPHDGEIHPEVRAESERRFKEIEAHPELLEPWAATTARIRAHLHEKCCQKNRRR